MISAALQQTWESLVKPTAFFNWATFRLFDETGIEPVPAAAAAAAAAWLI